MFQKSLFHHWKQRLFCFFSSMEFKIRYKLNLQYRENILSKFHSLQLKSFINLEKPYWSENHLQSLYANKRFFLLHDFVQMRYPYNI